MIKYLLSGPKANLLTTENKNKGLLNPLSTQPTPHSLNQPSQKPHEEDT